MNRFKLLSAATLLSARISPKAIAAQINSKYIAPSQALQYISEENIKIGAVQLGLRPYNTLGDYLSHMIALVRQATEKGAQLVCFPEFCGLLPLSLSETHYEACTEFVDDLLAGEAEQSRLYTEVFQKHLSAPLFDCYYNTFSLLAHRFQVYILAGSTVLATREGLHNRSFLFAPNGDCILEQDKLCLTLREQRLGFVPGSDLELASTPLGRLSVLLGRDSRLFEPTKAAAARGAQILLCPGGMHRTESTALQQSGALMRCQEQQLFAATACMVGDLFDITFRGRAEVVGPYELSRTGNGVFAQAASSSTQEGVAVGRLNLQRLGHHMDLHTADANPALYRQLAEVYASLKNAPAPYCQTISAQTQSEEPK